MRESGRKGHRQAEKQAGSEGGRETGRQGGRQENSHSLLCFQGAKGVGRVTERVTTGDNRFRPSSLSTQRDTASGMTYDITAGDCCRPCLIAPCLLSFTYIVTMLGLS